MTARRLPGGLFGRLALLLVAAFLILHLVTLLTVRFFTDRQAARNEVADQAGSLALCLRLLDHVREQAARAELVHRLERLDTLNIRLTPGPEPETQSRDDLSLYLRSRLLDSLANLYGLPFQAGHLRTSVRRIPASRGADGAVVPVAARGAVIARCWLTHTVEMSLLEIRSEETGREAVVQEIETPWFTWPTEPDTPDFLASNAYITQTPVVGCFFPVWRKTTVLREVSLEYARRSEAEVRAEAGDAALERLKTLLYGYEIIDKWVDYCMIEDDTLAATATAEWLMDIAGPAPA